MSAIANALSDPRVIDALAAASAARFDGSAYIRSAIGEELRKGATEAVAIIRRYQEGGASYSTFTKLKTLRDEHLAHRQLEPTPVEAGGYDALDAQVEAFYRDMSTLIRLLLHVVEKTAYSPEEAAEVYARYAALFWAAVRGEWTDGHPSYRPAPVPPT